MKRTLILFCASCAAVLCLAFALPQSSYYKVSAELAADLPGTICADGSVVQIGEPGSGASYISDLPAKAFHVLDDGTALIATGNAAAPGTYSVTIKTRSGSRTQTFELLPMPAEHTLYIYGVENKHGTVEYDPVQVRPATAADRLVGVYRNWRGADRATEVAAYLAPFTSDREVVYARLENAAGCHRVVPVELRR